MGWHCSNKILALIYSVSLCLRLVCMRTCLRACVRVQIRDSAWPVKPGVFYKFKIRFHATQYSLKHKPTSHSEDASENHLPPANNMTMIFNHIKFLLQKYKGSVSIEWLAEVHQIWVVILAYWKEFWGESGLNFSYYSLKVLHEDDPRGNVNPELWLWWTVLHFELKQESFQY